MLPPDLAIIHQTARHWKSDVHISFLKYDLNVNGSTFFNIKKNTFASVSMWSALNFDLLCIMRWKILRPTHQNLRHLTRQMTILEKKKQLLRLKFKAACGKIDISSVPPFFFMQFATIYEDESISNQPIHTCLCSLFVVVYLLIEFCFRKR